MTKLSSRLVADRAKLAQGRDAKAAAVAKTVKDTTAQIAALKKATGSSDKFGPFFEALQQECDQLALLGESPNGDAVAEAEQGLKDMQARIKQFSPDGAPKGGATLDSVTGRLTASEKALKAINDTLAKNCPKTLAKLNKDLAALRTALAKQEPQASITALDAFDAACKAAEGDAAKVIEVRTEFDQLLPSVQVAAAAFTKQQAAPDYAKALTARIEDAVKQAKKPDELYAALQKLNAVDEELKDAALKPGAALAKEGQIRQKAQADAAAKAEWQRSVALFESKRLPDVEAAVSAGGTKGLVDELKNMLKAAKQTADKGDAAQALKQLKLADARAGEIIAAPQGAGIGARNDLPADAKLYGEAVSALRDLLQRLPAAGGQGHAGAAAGGHPAPRRTGRLAGRAFRSDLVRHRGADARGPRHRPQGAACPPRGRARAGTQHAQPVHEPSADGEPGEEPDRQRRIERRAAPHRQLAEPARRQHQPLDKLTSSRADHDTRRMDRRVHRLKTDGKAAPKDAAKDAEAADKEAALKLVALTETRAALAAVKADFQKAMQAEVALKDSFFKDKKKELLKVDGTQTDEADFTEIDFSAIKLSKETQAIIDGGVQVISREGLRLSQLKVERAGKPAPLFEKKELEDEYWVPLVRERILPETFVGDFSPRPGTCWTRPTSSTNRRWPRRRSRAS